MPPPPIVRVEGWREYVNRSSAKMPKLPSLEAYEAYSREQKKEFNKERKKYLSEMPLLETPQMKTIHEDALRLSVMNYSAPPGARPGIVLDGLGTVGKSSIATELGKKYELSWRKNILPQINNAIMNPIPVVYITLPGEIAISDFNRLITSFMGIPVPQSAKIPWVNDRIIDATQACGTTLFIIDDIHFLQMRNKTAQTVNNHLKYLASSTSATFIYAGINVEGSGLLMEGQSKEMAFASQTQHRFKTYAISPFERSSPKLKILLSSFEQNLPLIKHKAGKLADMSDYIHDRTGGFFGSISGLIREASYIAIDKGEEALNRVILEKVRLDYASEAHKKTSGSRA